MEQKPEDLKPADNLDTGKRTQKTSLSDLKEKVAKPKPQKKGPGRPKKAQEPPPLELNVDVEMIAQAIKMTSAIVASRAGDIWLLSDDEIRTLAIAFDGVAQKYMPSMGKWAVEINAIGAVGMIIVPRLIAHIQMKKLQNEEITDATA